MFRGRLALFSLLLLLLSCQTVWADQQLVAVILTKDHPRFQSVHETFQRELGELFPTDQINIYVQTPNPDLMSLRNSVRKAVAIGADLIVTYGSLSTLAAQSESFTTPIIYADVYEPVEQGLIPSRDEPGRLITGISGNGPTQSLVRFFQQTTGAEHIAVVFDPDDPTGRTQHALLERKSRKGGLHITSLPVDSNRDLLPQLGALPANVEGIYFADGIMMKHRAPSLLDHASKQGIPVITQIPGLADLGAFMVIEEDLVEQGQVLARYVSRCLSGEVVRDLPPAYPRNVAFVVNMAAASKLDIHVPFDVLAVSSRVVR